MEYEIKDGEVWIKGCEGWYNAGKLADVQKNYEGLIEDAE